MNKLEQALNTMTLDQKEELTISDKAMLILAKKARKANFELDECKAKFALELKDLQFDFDQAQIAMKILGGSKGYYVDTQFSEELPVSGFAAFEEFSHTIGDMYVSVHLEKPEPKFGEVVYEIAENGMMTLVE